MPARLRRLRRFPLVSMVLAACLLAVLALPAGAANGFSRDLYFAAGYERQVDNRTCIPASTAMMMNFIARRDLRLDQMAILRYAQPRDALNNATQRGSDPLGWSRAATYYSRYTGKPTTYNWEAYGSESAALRRAARQIAVTGKPVGLLVAHGTHAVVMTGFSATGNPASMRSWTLSSIWYSDPYGYAHRSVAAAYSPLNTYTQTDATSYYDAKWYGKYVVIIPQG
ncbi:MAG TPA: C39 family peptidase [Candidatus Limnocylindrales bacterium]|nr:C39 family peptidase [Candidatus Limnocylindrales bacterium]